MSSFASFSDRETFYNRVWDLVRQIPPGKVVTYGQVAQLLAPPKGVEMQTYRAFGARWVGGAMAACPPDVPWQRVINAQGKISIRSGSGHLRQISLLEKEGVFMDPAKQKIDLKKYGWDPDPDLFREP